MSEEYAVMYRWFNDMGYEADIAALRQEYLSLLPSSRTSAAMDGRARSFLQRVKL